MSRLQNQTAHWESWLYLPLTRPWPCSFTRIPSLSFLLCKMIGIVSALQGHQLGFDEIDQWGKSPGGALDVSLWPPDGARHPQCTCARLGPPKGWPGAQRKCVSVSPLTECPATFLHFRKLIYREACETAHRTAVFFLSCPSWGHVSCVSPCL